jgi:hypothetical protein
VPPVAITFNWEDCPTLICEGVAVAVTVRALVAPKVNEAIRVFQLLFDVEV